MTTSHDSLALIDIAQKLIRYKSDLKDDANFEYTKKEFKIYFESIRDILDETKKSDIMDTLFDLSDTIC